MTPTHEAELAKMAEEYSDSFCPKHWKLSTWRETDEDRRTDFMAGAQAGWRLAIEEERARIIRLIGFHVRPEITELINASVVPFLDPRPVEKEGGE